LYWMVMFAAYKGHAGGPPHIPSGSG